MSNCGSPPVNLPRILTSEDIEALRRADDVWFIFEAAVGKAILRATVAADAKPAVRQYFPNVEGRARQKRWSRTIPTAVEITGYQPGTSRPLWGLSDAITTLCRAVINPQGLISTATSLMKPGDTLTQLWFADNLRNNAGHKAGLTRDELGLQIDRVGGKGLVFHLASSIDTSSDPTRLILRETDAGSPPARPVPRGAGVQSLW